MTLDESIQGMRLRVMKRAEAIGVTAACREAGISRTLFYRWRGRLQRYGVDGVHPRRLRARPGPAPQLTPPVERRLLAVAIAEATWGAARLAVYAQRLWRLRLAPSTVQRLLRRHGLGDAAAAVARARTSQRAAGGAADRTDPADAVAAAPRPHPARAGRAPRRARLSGYLLHRQAQGGGEGLADHRLRCRDLLRRGAHPAGAVARRDGPVFARRPAAGRAARRLAAATRPDGSRQ